ncbi:hypothetical protein RhiirB3_454191 [Rhizophagus irregularis]|nr:hypothetical protein RhiirB3_454191 [Rhizophagus irregularis]
MTGCYGNFPRKFLINIYEKRDPVLMLAEARNLFKKHWDNIIKIIEDFLTASPDVTSLALKSASNFDQSRQRTRWKGRRYQTISKKYIKICEREKLIQIDLAKE